MSTVSQNPELIKNLMALLDAHRPLFKQERVFLKVKALVLALLFAFGRRTMTQLLMTLGLTDSDWSSAYHIFQLGRLDPGRASDIMLAQALEHIDTDAVFGHCWL
ncbi:MAG: hypothetical protein ACLFTK_05245 [Anaerolineales bacterium]